MGSILVPEPPCGTEACAAQLRHLATAAEHRDVIGMAKGLLMTEKAAQRTPDEAFAMLRTASQRENVKIWQIANRIVYGSPMRSE